MKQTTLCIIEEYPRVLLGMKKRGFGQGRWNGFGGKVHENESIEDAVKRELMEEIGVKANKIGKAGIITFEFADDTETIEMHIFRVKEFYGEPTETEEMKPQWFHIDKIPFKKMWSDDKHWFPLFLEGKKFRGKFLFDNEKSNKIIKFQLNEIK